jgi:hypothetical protein
LRFGFVDDEVTPAEILTVEGIDGFLGVFIAGDFDESETARLAGEAVANEGYG